MRIFVLKWFISYIRKSTGELKDAMDDVSSILNKKGNGTLYFGVKPNGDVCGQEITESTLNDVATTFKVAIKPMIYPSINEIELDGKRVIKVEFCGTARPYSSYGRYYKRVSDRAEEMTPDELKHMMLNIDYTSIWENNVTSFDISSINEQSLRKFYDKAVNCGKLIPLSNYNEIELLTMLGLMIDGKLTNAGYFLFSKNEPTVLKMAVYATDERINFLDINRVRGNIFDLIDISATYISEHMNWKVQFDNKTTSRIEISEIPMEAIREIIVNAFAHANYRSVTVHEIFITPTIIDIYNPGEFPINYKPEDFADRRIQSMPRNKKILDILYRSKNVEIQGSGIRRVLELCKKNNVNYSYYNNEYGFRFSFSRTNVTSNVTLQLTKTDLLVFNELKYNPHQTRDEIALKIGKTVRTVQRSIDKLKTNGKIIRIGNKNHGYWEVIDE